MLPSCLVSPPRTLPRALAAAALVLGANPAMADSTGTPDSLPVDQANRAESTSYLTPVISWDDEAAGDEHGAEAPGRLSAGDVAGATASLVRRRPGMFSSPPPVPSPAASPAVAARSRPDARFFTGMPIASRRVTSGFGLRRHPLLGDLRPHAGVDLAAPAGSPVVATADGAVSVAGWSGGYGLLVAVEHGRGRQTRYAHLSRLNVASGQRVRKGDVIGFVGSTGRSTGPHLHYETRINGKSINPLRH